LFLVVVVATALALPAIWADPLEPEEMLGKLIFFDDNLSINGNQSCAACHAPEVGWTGPIEEINFGGGVYEGSVAGRFGGRKPPSSAYASPSPVFHRDRKGLFIGGNFWDGRATGETLGNPAAEQAQGPFLNPLEQALPSSAAVIDRICTGSYAGMFLNVCGSDACDPANTDAAYDCVGLTIAAYESSSEVNAFTSKYDYYLAGEVRLSRMEKKGLAIFRGKGKCSKCHVLNGEGGAPQSPTADGADSGGIVDLALDGTATLETAPAVQNRPLFTDFSFDNLGVPKNPVNPFYEQLDFNPAGYAWLDYGLGGFLAARMDYAQYAAEENGKHKVPTLRNVDLRPYPGFVKAYGHNGYFKSLKDIVHFYNTRDVLPHCPEDGGNPGVDCWPEPEVAMNVNTSELGDLRLSETDEWALVEFMKTLSDGYQP
jgi:cytochrome c peroxidase